MRCWSVWTSHSMSRAQNISSPARCSRPGPAAPPPLPQHIPAGAAALQVGAGHPRRRGCQHSARGTSCTAAGGRWRALPGFFGFVHLGHPRSGTRSGSRCRGRGPESLPQTRRGHCCCLAAQVSARPKSSPARQARRSCGTPSVRSWRDPAVPSGLGPAPCE